MKSRKNVIYNIWFAYMMFYICFKHLFINDNFLYLIMDAFFGLTVMKGLFCRVKINRRAWWGFFAALVIDMFFTIFYAISVVDAVKFSLVYLNFTVIAFWFTQLSGWQIIFYKWIKAGCLFHLVFTYFSVIFTDQALKITQYFFTDDVQQITTRWAKEFHIYAGFAGQTGTNAFFAAILIGLFFSELHVRGRSKSVGVLFIVSLIGMIFTGKKGLLIASALSVLTVYYVTGGKVVKRKLAAICSAIVFFFLLTCVIFYKQLYNIFYTSVFTRIRIMEGVLLAVKESPFLGNGVNSVGNFTYEGHLGHNIYLQMWAEQGIVGLIILLAALFFTLHMTYIRIRSKRIDAGNQISIFFSLYMQIFVIIYGFSGNPLYDYNIIAAYFMAIAAGFADMHANNTATERTWESIAEK